MERQRSVLYKTPHNLIAFITCLQIHFDPNFIMPFQLFASPASAVMGCNGCLRAVLCENRTWRGPASIETMGRGVGSRLKASLPSLSPSLLHTEACIPPLPYLPLLYILLLLAFSSFVLSPSSPALTHNLPFSSLPLFHAYASPLRCFCFMDPPESEAWNAAGSGITPPPLAFPCWVIVGGIERTGVTAKEVN